MVPWGPPDKLRKMRFGTTNVYGRPPIPLRISAWCVFWRRGTDTLLVEDMVGRVWGISERRTKHMRAFWQRVINGGVTRASGSLLHVWSVNPGHECDCRFPPVRYGLLSLDYNNSFFLTPRFRGPLGPRRCTTFLGVLTSGKKCLHC
ncbi:hypothetical protein TcBrA4_0031990 [Trypanosoma cruzi]|nr:hypothetical protein TcBrA4_0031990 [Trypanosoma cruzi]